MRRPTRCRSSATSCPSRARRDRQGHPRRARRMHAPVGTRPRQPAHLHPGTAPTARTLPFALPEGLAAALHLQHPAAVSTTRPSRRLCLPPRAPAGDQRRRPMLIVKPGLSAPGSLALAPGSSRPSWPRVPPTLARHHSRPRAAPPCPGPTGGTAVPGTALRKIPPACPPSGDAPWWPRLIPSSGTVHPNTAGHFLPPGLDMATGQGDDSEANPYPGAEGSARALLA